MLTALGLTLLGVVVLVIGAELVTRGGSAFAARMGVPPIAVGLTIVAVGTSTPELAVGIDAARQGNGALAVGNIAGANIVNLLLILGLSALARALPLHLQTIRLDLPAMIAAAIAMWVMALDGSLDRTDGTVLILAGIAYTLLVLHWVRHETRAVKNSFAGQYRPPDSWGRRARLRALAALLAGIVVIVYGAHVFVDATVTLARLWGVSDTFIGLTVVALSTTSPEMVTTIVATVRHERDIAIGNLLGSSVYNIVFILGVTSLVPAAGLPVSPELIRIDIPVMMLVAFACLPVFVTGRQVSRPEGALFIAAYLVYLTYLLVART